MAGSALKTASPVIIAALFLSLSIVAGAVAQIIESEKVALKWLGTAGWEIQLGKTIILIDPFLTRKDWLIDAEWKTDEQAVLKVIKGADYIFAGHSHGDHIGDIPFIAKRFGSMVIGSRTTTNLMLTAGVNKSRLVTINGGENLIAKQFSVRVIESRHGILSRLGRKGPPRAQEILEPWSGPIKGRDFVEGGCFLFNFTFGKHKVLHQSTGNFTEDKLNGERTDVALMNSGVSYNLANALKTLAPKIIIVHHFDDWWAPFSKAIQDSNTRRVQRFARDVEAVDGQIKVIVPEFFTTYTLE